MKVTADTITDEQLRELRASVMPGSPLAESCTFALALALPPPPGLDSLNVLDDDEREAAATITEPQEQAAARARCAEILNTRHGGNS